MTNPKLKTEVILLWSKDAVYFDLPSNGLETWNLNLDILYLENDEVYINGTIDGEKSTKELRNELLKISRHF